MNNRKVKSKTTDGKSEASLSMHDGIAVWYDCCSCEAEPYWAELAEEMEADLGSNYEKVVSAMCNKKRYR